MSLECRISKSLTIYSECLFSAIGIVGDVRKKDDVVKVLDATIEHYGKLDILVNAAAGNFLVPAEDLSPNGFQTVIDIDAVGTFTVCHEALKYLKKGGPGRDPSKGGLIINISATLHYTATWYQIHVSAAKMNKSEPVASVELYSDADQQRKPSNTSAMIGHSINQVISSQISTPPLKVDGSMSMPADIVKSVDSRRQSCVINPERDSHVRVESKVQELCSDKLSLKIETQGLQHRDTDYREFSQSHTPTKAASTSKDTIAPRDRSEFILESQLHVVETDSSEVKNDLLSSDIQSFRYF